MIVFENPGEIDILSISTFGISVKEGESPIGFFGTGLKYAIAILLRTGHSIKIFSGLQTVQFGLSQETVRGKSFQFVTMDIDMAGSPQPIGFTTELGKTWELWKAYRELACNARDESGSAYRSSEEPEPEAGVTKVIVHGSEFDALHDESHRFMLDDAPDLTIGSLEIRKRPSKDFFYRGIKVGDLPAPSQYTYNTTGHIDLTEDRTAKYQFMIPNKIASELVRSEDESLLRAVLTADDDSLESRLDFDNEYFRPSDTFVRVTGQLIADRMMKVNATAVNVWKAAEKRAFNPREIELTPVQQKSVDRAMDFCARLGFQVRDSYPIKYVESLGEGIMGLAADETIYIAERVFHLGGSKQLASTLIEEYIHLRHGWGDMTRELQSFLFDKLVSVGEELVGEPL